MIKKDRGEVNWIYVEYVMMRELHQQKSEIDNMAMDEVLALVELHRRIKEEEIESIKREARRNG